MRKSIHLQSSTANLSTISTAGALSDIATADICKRHRLLLLGGISLALNALACNQVETAPCAKTTTSSETTSETGNGGSTSTKTTSSISTTSTTSESACPVDSELIPQDPFCENYTGPTGPLFCTTATDCPEPFTYCTTAISTPELKVGICSFDLSMCDGLPPAGWSCFVNGIGENFFTDARFNSQHCGGPCNPVPEGWSCSYGLPTQCSTEQIQDCNQDYNNPLKHCTLVTIDGQASKGNLSFCFDGLNDKTNCGSIGNICESNEICDLGNCEPAN